MIRTLALTLTLAATFCASVASASPLITILPTTSAAFSGYEAFNAIDTGPNRYLTDFAGQGTGVGTHIDFSFSIPVSFSNIVYTDRTSSGSSNKSNMLGVSDYVTEYKYDFSNEASFDTIVSTFTSTVFTAPSAATSYLDFQHADAFSSINAQFVRFTVMAANGSNPGASDFTFTTTEVPEPATTVLLGLGLLGFAASRRKSSKNKNV